MEIFLKLPKAIKSYQKLSKAIKSYQKLSKAIKSYQKLLKTIKSYQKLSKAIYSNNLSYLKLPRTETNGYIVSNILRLLMKICYQGKFLSILHQQFISLHFRHRQKTKISLSLGGKRDEIHEA